MYAAIVRRIIRAGFRALSAGDAEFVVRRFHSQIVLVFIGTTALGGERRGVQAARAWFQQLLAIFPGIQFTTHQVIVQGWPWNTLIATRFSLAAPRRDGGVYSNEGMQFIRLRWGRVLEDRIYEDTQKLEQELQQRLHVEANT